MKSDVVPEPKVTAEGEAFASPPQRIEYPEIPIPAAGDYAEVAPGILWLRIPMPIDLNHINLWLLEDGDGWTLVDSGLNADMCKQTWETLETKLFTSRPLKRIFVTHLHPDHIGLARWLQERHQVPVWMSTRGVELARLFASTQSAADLAEIHAFIRGHGYTDEDMLNKFFGGRMYRSAISGMPEIAHFPKDGDVIEIGTGRWRAYETNGHAEGHQCLSNAERRILISGDQVLPTISSNVSFSTRGGDSNPLNSYLESLERLSELDAETLVLPSHGKPFRGLRTRAADLIEHHRDHLAAVIEACAVPKTAFDLVPVLFKRRLVGAHWMFAMGETIAHTEYLALQGKLQRETDSTGTVRYLRAGS
ncbi:MAG TPA: MBL fold metallo-hydrolase [Steroidobacteraceae bacterium]|nr:MBL fold metallo-hydrolase [Steroidobacteraceae bacterium]